MEKLIKVYVAAPVYAKDAVIEICDDLQIVNPNFEMPRWPYMDPGYPKGDDAALASESDLDDIAASDLFIFLGFPGGKGGRHVELGYAIGLAKPIIGLGFRQSIFEYAIGTNLIPNSYWLEPRSSYEESDAEEAIFDVYGSATFRQTLNSMISKM